MILTLAYHGRRLWSRVPSLQGLVVGRSGGLAQSCRETRTEEHRTTLQTAFSSPCYAACVLLTTFRSKHLEASLVFFVAKQNASNAPLSLHPNYPSRTGSKPSSLISPFTKQEESFPPVYSRDFGPPISLYKDSMSLQHSYASFSHLLSG